MAEIAVGALIGQRYRVEHHVGEGGMGAVWVAEDDKLHRWVAVKLLGERCAASRGARERFEREAMALARLRSPHVVQVFDYGIDATAGPYMVMELLNGEDLYSWLKRNRPVPLAVVARIMLQAAKGLGAAHRAGIVHRDLKPANLYVVRDHEEQSIKVFDFGLAKGLDDVKPLRDRTGEGVLLGTPRYMSPEQAHGAKLVDHRSDLWSLGVIAYLAITGGLPFRGSGVGEVIAKIQKEPHKRPSEIVADLPAEVDAFFDRALAKDPEARFQSAQELAEALRRLAPDASTSAELLAEDPGDTAHERDHREPSEGAEGDTAGDFEVDSAADGASAHRRGRDESEAGSGVDDTELGEVPGPRASVEDVTPAAQRLPGILRDGSGSTLNDAPSSMRDGPPDDTLLDEPSSFELATTKIALIPEVAGHEARQRSRYWLGVGSVAAAALVAAMIAWPRATRGGAAPAGSASSAKFAESAPSDRVTLRPSASATASSSAAVKEAAAPATTVRSSIVSARGPAPPASAAPAPSAALGIAPPEPSASAAVSERGLELFDDRR
jgi:serine/threonine protein kinase